MLTCCFDTAQTDSSTNDSRLTFCCTFLLCSLTSPDGSVFFSFTHNVCGREIYAEGSVDAALFLAKKIREGATNKIYNMIDVLREGAMR